MDTNPATYQRTHSKHSDQPDQSSQSDQQRSYATRDYLHPNYLRWMAAYSVPDHLSMFSRLMVIDNFGELVPVGYCYYLEDSPEPMEVEFRQLSFDSIAAS